MHLSLARCPDGSAYKYRRIIVLFRWNISFGGSQSCQFIHLRSGASIAVSDQFIPYYLYYIFITFITLRQEVGSSKGRRLICSLAYSRRVAFLATRGRREFIFQTVGVHTGESSSQQADGSRDSLIIIPFFTTHCYPFQ